MPYTLKQRVGALAIDWPKYEGTLRKSWLHIHNRNERLRGSPDGRGVACEWQWTSDLHVTKVFPSLGIRLLQRATGQWPINFADEPIERDGDVQVSFIIGHRGSQRIPHLLTTVATIAAQRGVRCECLVVEQSVLSEARDQLPRWVRYTHTPIPIADMPYCRSWALNVGARAAVGKILVFHDNDMLVPESYASEVWTRHAAGYDVINLKRFVFYLSQSHSQQIAGERRLGFAEAPETIVQNLEAGGSVAVANAGFFGIGGYDESFVGWGGEDNEFWERAQTLRVWPYTYLPIVHLWHAPQQEKLQHMPPTVSYYRHRTALTPAERIAELVPRDFGNAARMDPIWSPQSRNS